MPNWGFPDVAAAVFDEAKITFDAGKAFGTAGHATPCHFTYGRQKLTMSQEAHTSSKKIKTIERSALANTIYAVPLAPSVSPWMEPKRFDWAGAVAILDT